MIIMFLYLECILHLLQFSIFFYIFFIIDIYVCVSVLFIIYTLIFTVINKTFGNNLIFSFYRYHVPGDNESIVKNGRKDYLCMCRQY